MTEKDNFKCSVCDNYTNISRILCPYIFKQMLQELMAMHIYPKINIDHMNFDKFTWVLIKKNILF